MQYEDKYMMTSAESMLSLSDRVKEICKFLFTNFKISYYSCRQVDPNAEGFLVLSHERIFRDLIDSNLMRYETLNLDFVTYKKMGYYAHDLMKIYRPDLQTYLTVLENYGYGHVFAINEVIYDNLIPKIVCHTFATNISGRKSFNQYYFENIRSLLRFTKYFANEFGAFTHKIKYFKSTIDMEAKAKAVRKFKNILRGYENENYDSIRNPDVPELFSLSKRQREIIHWYIKGKNAAETAELLNISRRTVENHFYRLGKKFFCASKTQLLVKLFENNLIDYE